MKYISFIAALALLVTGTQSCIVRIDKNNALEMVRLFNERTIKASGIMASKEIKTENCHRLTVSNGIYVEYLQDGKNFVTVNASDNILPYIDVTENDGELTIGVKDSASYSRIWNMDAKVTVHGSALGSLDLKGSGDFTCKELSMPDDLVTIAITGSGDISLVGKTGKATYMVVGSGDIDAAKMKCGAEPDITVTGSGSVSYQTADGKIKSK